MDRECLRCDKILNEVRTFSTLTCMQEYSICPTCKTYFLWERHFNHEGRIFDEKLYRLTKSIPSCLEKNEDIIKDENVFRRLGYNGSDE